MEQLDVIYDLCKLLSKIDNKEYRIEFDNPFIILYRDNIKITSMRPASAIRRICDRICALTDAD